MKKTVKLFLVNLIILTLSATGCAKNSRNKNNEQELVKLLLIENFLNKKQPGRISSVKSIYLMAKAPDKIGSFLQEGEIANFEIKINGAGYTKRYVHYDNESNKNLKIDLFTYNSKYPQILFGIDNDVVRADYNSYKKKIWGQYTN